jgi:hypothetical protein
MDIASNSEYQVRESRLSRSYHSDETCRCRSGRDPNQPTVQGSTWNDRLHLDAWRQLALCSPDLLLSDILVGERYKWKRHKYHSVGT